MTLASALLLGACATGATKTTTNTFTPAESSKTLLVKPDVEANLLLASGLTELRADWTDSATQSMTNALQAELDSRGSELSVMSTDTLTPAQIQMIKLNEVVIQSRYINAALPTNKDKFELTVGPGVSVLKGSSGADYALMVSSKANFQSAGKMAVNLVLAGAFGVAGQTGSTISQASLVDLNTGDLVWTNTSLAGLGADIRTDSGASGVVKALLKDFPL